MRIRINKRSDGGGVLHCDRADGSSTCQKQIRHAAFFAHHDLTRYAVETALGYRRGFFGLVVEGRDIEDTTGKGARRPLPEDAMEVERLVGTLDIERAGGVRWTIEEFNACAPRPLTQDALDRRRARRAELFRMWSAVAPGDSLELEWPSCKQSKACRTDAAFGQRTTAEQSKPSPLPAKSASRSPREKRSPAGRWRA